MTQPNAVAVMQNGALVIKKPARISGEVEIVRSFSYKLNAGNYESRDFFASQKATCPIEDAEQVSEMLYEFCKAQVLSNVKCYLRDMEAQRERKNPTEAQQMRRSA